MLSLKSVDPVLTWPAKLGTRLRITRACLQICQATIFLSCIVFDRDALQTILRYRFVLTKQIAIYKTNDTCRPMSIWVGTTNNCAPSKVLTSSQKLCQLAPPIKTVIAHIGSHHIYDPVCNFWIFLAFCTGKQTFFFYCFAETHTGKVLSTNWLQKLFFVSV